MELAMEYAPVHQIFQKIHENYCPIYAYHLAKFSDLMSCGSKDIFKNAAFPVYLYSS